MTIYINGTSGISGVDGSAGTPAIQGTDANTGISFPAADTVAINTGGTERVRTDSSGRLLVGTSSTLAGATDSLLQIRGNSSGSQFAGKVALAAEVAAGSIVSGTDLGAIYFGNVANGIGGLIECKGDAQWGTNDYPGRLLFSTTADGASSPTERMRINQKGEFKATTTGDYPSVSTGGHMFRTAENLPTLTVNNNIGSGFADTVMQVTLGYAANTTNSTFLYCNDTAAGRMYVRTNGGIGNYQANNVNLSDRNLKKDISPAADTWDCIKEWEIVNYRYKDQADDAGLNLGVIAQQVAESCPEVITVFEEAKDDQPEKLGVKEQQMYWMAIKALQEAQVRIEQLETEKAEQQTVLDDLLARVTALEAA